MQLRCYGLLQVLRLLDLAEISIHQGADGLIHSFLAHLERVTDFDLLHRVEGVLPSDCLTGQESTHPVVVFRLLEAS